MIRPSMVLPAGGEGAFLFAKAIAGDNSMTALRELCLPSSMNVEKFATPFTLVLRLKLFATP